MSDYVRQKVVRYKLTQRDLNHFDVKNGFELRDKFEHFLDYDADKSKYFVHAMTESGDFLDFILIDEEGYGDYGKIRKLTETETDKYAYILADQFMKMDNAAIHEYWPDRHSFRLVDFCWYNCSEAPDYFDETTDDFWKEV